MMSSSGYPHAGAAGAAPRPRPAAGCGSSARGDLPAATAAQATAALPDDQAIRAVGDIVANPLPALYGPLFGATLGGLTAWKIVVPRSSWSRWPLRDRAHTRADEEAGRLELVRGRRRPPTRRSRPPLLVVALADLAIVVLVALGHAARATAGGSVPLGLAIGVVGVVFAAVAAVAAQLAESARAATASPPPSSAGPTCCAPSATPGRAWVALAVAVRLDDATAPVTPATGGGSSGWPPG